ncbi:hypothetical protein Rsub_10437 [Raphidocelis subcapitata]|uniref:Uncharacterized protein n=1 Tax=Raphidocelis subcapitata TaxID=307507 RepID=A0A2V0PCD4_9CHLO|nr:hypothetical protein Rsub_10437 [Raphidocelis subcapitata]|eukprot:GBF97514.1 hypothetical protein Rsub_10437 [Raphidocelis subcapitata]
MAGGAAGALRGGPDEDSEDAWGGHEGEGEEQRAASGARASSSGGRARPAASLADAWRLAPLLELRLSSGGGGARGGGPVPPLRALALAVLARHVSELAAAAGEGGCGWLPAEAKAALLAAARRRGELSDAVLLALVDGDLACLDVSGTKVSSGALIKAAARAPRLRALDASSAPRVSAAALRRVAALCPGLALLRLGGPGPCRDAAAAALPKIVPAIAPDAVLEDDGGGVSAAAAAEAAAAAAAVAAAAAAVAAAAAAPPRAGVGAASAAAPASAGEAEPAAAAAAAAAADSWEDLADEAGGGSGGSGIEPGAPRDSAAAAAAGPWVAPGAPGRLWALRAVVWPDAPREAREALARLCPRVALNPAAEAAAPLLGQLPRELDPAVALDAAAFEAVGPGAMQDLEEEAARLAAQRGAGPSVAERFRQAFIDRDAARRSRDARLARAEAARAARDRLRRSGGERALTAWLDSM